jgi:hypothetical protein
MEGWILEENVRAFFETAAELVGYRFDDTDWDAVAHGLTATDSETNRWFDYPLEGERAVAVSAANDPGTSVVLVRASGDDAAARALDTAAMLMQSYTLTRR